MTEIISKTVRKTRAEKILEDIESNLRKIIAEKKELWRDFKESQKRFEGNWKEAERIENKLILLWDYWQREVEILKLEKQIQAGVLPTEREKLMGEIKKLNSFNITLEHGFKQRKIDKDIVTELRKKLGISEEDRNV